MCVCVLCWNEETPVIRTLSNGSHDVLSIRVVEMSLQSCCKVYVYTCIVGNVYGNTCVILFSHFIYACLFCSCASLFYLLHLRVVDYVWRISVVPEQAMRVMGCTVKSSQLAPPYSSSIHSASVLVSRMWCTFLLHLTVLEEHQCQKNHKVDEKSVQWTE